MSAHASRYFMPPAECGDLTSSWFLWTGDSYLQTGTLGKKPVQENCWCGRGTVGVWTLYPGGLLSLQWCIHNNLHPIYTGGLSQQSLSKVHWRTPESTVVCSQQTPSTLHWRTLESTAVCSQQPPSNIMHNPAGQEVSCVCSDPTISILFQFVGRFLVQHHVKRFGEV